MSSLTGRYEPPNAYHHAVHRSGSNRSTPRNGTISGNAQSLASPEDDESTSSISPSSRPRSRMAPVHDAPLDQQKKQLLLQQMNSATKPHHRSSRYRRSATLSPAAGHRRGRGRYDRDDSSDSNGDEATYPLLLPAHLASAGSWASRRPSNLATSKRSASPLQAISGLSGSRKVRRKPDLPGFARSALLRKTCSEPTELFMDECDRSKVEKIQDILSSLDFTKFHLINKKRAQIAAHPPAIRPVTSPLSPSNSSYASGRSSPLVTPSQSPDEAWATPRGSLLVPASTHSPDRPSSASLASSRMILKNTADGRERVEEDSDFMSTDIEELREAAQTIEALARRNRCLVDAKNVSEAASQLTAAPLMPLGHSMTSSTSAQQFGDDIPSDVVTPIADSSKNAESSASNSSLASSCTLPRRSGITTRLGGQPRGVMQFLPSVKSSDMLAKTTYESYLANKTRRAYQGQPPYRSNTCSSNESSTLDVTASSALGVGLRRKVSMPDQLYQASKESYRYHSYRQTLQYNQAQDSQEHKSESLDGQPVISVDTYLDTADIGDRKMSAPASTMTDANIRNQPRYNSFGSTRDNVMVRGSRMPPQYGHHGRQYSETEATMMIETSSPPPAEPSSLKGVDSLGSFSRFGRLLKSLRNSRQNSPELDVVNALSPASSDSPLSSPCPSEQSPSNLGLRYRPSRGQNVSIDAQQSRPRSQAATIDGVNAAGGSMSQSWHGGVSKMHFDLNTLAAGGSGSGIGTAAMSDSDSSMLQADLLLWQKRSKGSLRRHQDTRTHIVKELYDTEASYVDNLQLLVHKYLRPLKRPELCTLIDPMLVDEIFFQIPEVLGHHELFFAALKSRLDNWDNRQKIGDIILNNFTKQSVIDTYTAFINNWKNAKHAIRAACHAKPAFAKYLERCSREHKNKLTLDALLIMPVQRIPRYELLIKELLKHTSVEHPDHPVLIRAQKEIHELATKINHVEQEAGLAEQIQQRLREIEAIVDGLDDTHGVKKERCLFLFSDQLIITNVKRKSAGALKKIPTVTPASTTSCNFLESNKFKLLMKISLDDLETIKNNTALLQKMQEEIGQLQEDLRVLGKVSELLLLLKMHHDDLDKEVEKAKDGARRQLTEKQLEMTTNPLLISLDLLVTTEAGVETLAVTFQSADKRVAWEKCFNDAKEALVLSLSRRPPPVFLKPIAAQKTRSGLHYTCASPTIGRNEYGYPNVWICNSDGYVGQVCVMTLTPEPELSCCNGITNSRILCICAVPDAKRSGHRRARKGSTAATSPASQGSSSVVDSGYNLELDSDSSDNESGEAVPKAEPNGAPTLGVNGHSNSSSGVSADSTTPVSSAASSTTSAPELRKKAPKNGSAASTPDDVAAVEASRAPADDLLGPTMWLGTEDGCVHIFNHNDSVRTRKNKLKVQHGASVLVVTYFDDRVFVGLGDASLLYYDRDQDGHWDLEHVHYIELEQLSRGPISAMLVVINRLWLAIRNRICVLNPHSMKVEHVFQASSDVDSIVGVMTTSGLGVWLSMQGSPVIKLHHAHSYECLLEVNVSPIVTKTLAGCDDIIRQHKLSCLRVVTLLCCKDYLWIGTSAGVLLHLGIPHITHNTTRLNNTPGISSVPLGHCGQCRFLTCVELVQPSNLSQSNSRAGSSNTINELSRRRMSLNVASLQQGKVYVVSGGDGFEDFQDLSNDEDDDTGRDDSTNHILIWQS